MIKRSLVHLDASPRAAVRLALARSLAQIHDGEVSALYGVVPAMLSAPLASVEGIGTAASLLAGLDDEQRERARTLFQEAGAPDRLHWLDGGESPYRALMEHACTSDLLVLGQADPSDTRTGALPPDLVPMAISDSGRPTLVVPSAGRFDTTDGPVLVAWKPTREAARAVTAALPWLRRAPQVHLATQDDGDVPDTTAASVSHWLTLQGAREPVRHHRPAPGDVGDRLLSLAADLGASLLVMGCYGHSRAREWVLGGATRTVLRSMTVPVLMVH